MLKVKLTRRDLGLVKDLYTEPTEDRVAGKLFNFVMTLSPALVRPQSPVKRKTKSASTTVSRNRDIREIFAAPKKKKHQMLLSLMMIKVEINQ